MRDVVAARWLEFTKPLEGAIPHLYADIRNLLTIGFGYLVDPLSVALTLPLLRADGTPSSQAEITAEWLRVKGDPRCARLGYRYAGQLCQLHLADEAMGDLAIAKLHANDAVIAGRIEDWESLPACAQLAIHSLAWACGPLFNFPKLISAVNAKDFGVAAVHIQMNETSPEGLINSGLRARNQRDRILMLNAARVDAYQLDPDVLDWDMVLGVADEPTNPGTPSPVPPPDNAASSPTIHPFLSGLDPDDGNPPPEAA